MPLETDFNVSPFFDDYDPNKKYYRVLYRPSVAVQARELTQTQSMIQNQIESFAGNIYKDGSRIEGCSPTVLKNLDFVRVVDSFIDNPVATVLNIQPNYLLVGQTSKVKAQCIIPVEGLLIDPDGKTNRLYIKYIDSIAGGPTKFASEETILIYNENQDRKGQLDPKNLVFKINVISSTDKLPALGKGYGIKIEDGRIYQKGFFQIIDSQVAIVRDFDQIAGGMLVGFNTVEEIITESDDPTLNDNALGYPNENAPGAFRLRLNPIIVVKEEKNVKSDDFFFPIFTFSRITNDIVLDRSDDPYDEIARNFIYPRTFDSAGNFVVKPFLASSVPYLEDSNKFTWQLSSGKGYVNGAPVEWKNPDGLPTSRCFDSKVYRNQVVTANFGNYIIVNEFSGYFDTTSTSSVDVYDRAQKNVTTNNRGAIGNKIGTAKIKSYMYDSGSPGTPEAKYKIYITDITMFTGSSFASNAKSLVGADLLGTIYMAADLNLTSSGNATINQNDKTALLAYFGRQATKTLSPDGTWDTNFQFTSQSDGELQSNGFISITVGGSYPGGDDILGYGIGRLNDALESQIIVTLKNSVESEQLKKDQFGTALLIGINIVDNVKYAQLPISESALNIRSYFTPGEYIKIGTKYERVVSVVNNSTVQITSSGGMPETFSSTFSKWWPAGYKVPLFDDISGGPRFVEITSTSTFTVSTGVGNSSVLLIPSTTTPRVSVRYRMTRTNAQPAKKLVKKSVYTKLFFTNHPNRINGPWPLGFVDVFNIQAVYADGLTFSETNDVTNMFTFTSGQTDTSYETSQLVLKPQFRGKLANTPYLVVKSDIFVTDDSVGIGFFSVDSYPTSFDINAIPDDRIAWAQIPVYTAGNGTKFDLRDSLDYRSVKRNTAAVVTQLSFATVNPNSATDFRPNSSKYLVEADTPILTDVEVYLARRDVIGLNSQGKLIIVNGIPSENPRDPIYDADVMPVAIGYVPPYPSLTQDESNLYKRSDYLIKTKSVYNRGYTMRDIGVLDQRISRLEYYTTLNVLEQKTQSLTIKDAQNNDRFKNGIFADPMTSFIFSDVSDVEFRWSFDINRGFGRPMFKSQSVDFVYDATASQNIQLSGRCLTLPFTNELIIDQPYATKVRNNAQDAWSFLGQLELYPDYDMNKDETILPAQDINIDLFSPLTQLIGQVEAATGATILGTRYGEWETTSTTWVREALGGGWLQDVTTRNQVRTATDVTALPMTQSFNIDPFVTDVSVQPYMKSRTIAFIGRGLKPNTRVWAFFDKTPVFDSVAPGILNNEIGSDFARCYTAAYSSGKPEIIVKRTIPIGSPLITDANGQIIGVFVVPAGKFKTGDRELQIIDQDSLITGTDGALCKAAAVFTSSNISITKRGVNVTTTTPGYETKTRTQEQCIQSVRKWHDPLGQSFRIEAPETQSGVMITKIDLFFKTKSSTLGINVKVCGMVNGLPDPTTILADCSIASSAVQISDDATKTTTFVFENPVFINSNQDYAFYVSPDGNNPDYSMWVSEIGNYDITTGAQVFSNPYIGDLFRSSNSKSWIPLPREDIKFNIYAANYTQLEGTAYFNNENDEYIRFENYISKDSSKPVQVNDEIRTIKGPDEPIILFPTQKGVVQGIDIGNQLLTIDSSSGQLAVGQYIGVFRTPVSGTNSGLSSDTLIATFQITELQNPPIHSICPRFATAIPAGTFMGVSFKGTDAGFVKDANWTDLNFDTGKEMVDKERIVYSKSNESQLTQKSLSTKIVFKSENKYISPVINLVRKNALCIENIVNNIDNIKFEYTRQGTSIAKYISQKIVLADQQDAEDLKVYLSGYRPNGSDITLYVKFLSGDDTDLFVDKVWTKMVNDSAGLFSSNILLEDFKEFTFSVPRTRPAANTELPKIQQSAFLDPENNNFLTYYSGDNSDVKNVTFKTFAIKIVLNSDSGIWCPKIDDVRAIALQA